MQAIAAAGLDGSKALTASTDALELYRA